MAYGIGDAYSIDVRSGAWTGSNMEGYFFGGFKFVEGAMPFEPTTARPG